MAQFYSPAPAQPNNRQATTSLISGIVAWLLWLLFLCLNISTIGLFSGCLITLGFVSIIPWIIAIVTGHIGMSQIGRTGEGGKGMAIAGLIMGYLGVVLTLCTIALYIAGLFGLVAFSLVPTPNP